MWGSGVNEKEVDFLEVSKLNDEFHHQCIRLSKWQMDHFAHGENSQEDVVADFIERLSPQIARIKKDMKKKKSLDFLCKINVKCWKRSDYGLDTHCDRGQSRNLCEACGMEDLAMKKCSSCESVAYCGKEW